MLDWNDIDKLIKNICIKIKCKLKNYLENYEIIAITNGGIIPATIISYNLGIKNIHLFPIRNKKVIYKKIPFFETTKKYLLIDEIYDTGKTFQKTSIYLRFYQSFRYFFTRKI